MSADNILFWVAFGIIVVGEAMTFSRWWDRGYMLLTLGLAVLGAGSLVRGQWPIDYAIAALCFVAGLGIIYIAYFKERKHARTEERQGQVHGVVPEGSGSPAQQRRLPLGLRRPGRQRRTGSDQPPRAL